MTADRPQHRPSSLRVVAVRGKGRGIRAGRPFSRGEVIDVAPVVVIPGRERPMFDQTVLAGFTFAWDETTGSLALALGRVSLLNHSYEPNVAAEKHIAARMIHFRTLRDIDAGEELTLNYHGDPSCRDPLGFDVRP